MQEMAKKNVNCPFIETGAERSQSEQVHVVGEEAGAREFEQVDLSSHGEHGDPPPF